MELDRQEIDENIHSGVQDDVLIELTVKHLNSADTKLVLRKITDFNCALFCSIVSFNILGMDILSMRLVLIPKDKMSLEMSFGIPVSTKVSIQETLCPW